MNYVGIDLGTTNSAICSYDGVNVQLHKGPEQQDVTPSAIFFDRRGNKFVGSRAYNNAVRSPDNAAVLFKRLMGSSTPVSLPAVNLTMTPEECSSEILRTLFGYLPDNLRAIGETGTVITVPAAFNQMQKDATMSAAEAAGLGLVALMQEPVAAVMSVMRARKTEGVFLVYDLGGGTLDVAVAEAIAGRVSLLAHGGKEKCGGRDFDRALFAKIAEPWLRDRFALPSDLRAEPRFRALATMATWASERAKIELAKRDQATISLDPDTELRLTDLAGAEVYIDIPITRQQFDALISETVSDTVTKARETLSKSGFGSKDVDRIVFVGGPTHYGPLRERVASGLGIAQSTDVNPMTAVAEGAAIFAESVDWTSQSRGRKKSRGSLVADGPLGLSVDFHARVPDSRTRVRVTCAGASPGLELQVDSLDTGWSSGRSALTDGITIDLTLSKMGENTFKLFVFDPTKGPVAISPDRFVVVRTSAAVDAIPASHAIGVEVREKLGGRTVLTSLVKEGDHLPKKGRLVLKSLESLKAGSPDSLKFKLWEGDISDRPSENHFIGLFAVRGQDLEDGAVIAAGAELLCDYEITDSGNVRLDVSVPSIGASFRSGHNFYARQSGEVDYSKASQLIEEKRALVAKKIDEMAATIEEPLLADARRRLNRAPALSAADDPEAAMHVESDVQEVRRTLADVRKRHLSEIRRMELEGLREMFDGHLRQFARPTEVSAFDNLIGTAQRAIDNNSAEFESYLEELRARSFAILWRQDWFVIDRFKGLAESAYLFPSARQHAELVAVGNEALKADDIDRLRQVVIQLESSRIETGDDSEMAAVVNILRG